MDGKNRTLKLELIASDSSTIASKRGNILGNIKIDLYTSEFGYLKIVVLSNDDGKSIKYIESPCKIPTNLRLVEDKNKVDEFYNQEIIFAKLMSPELVKKIKELQN